MAHRVLLSPQALKVLKALRRVTADSRWVSPSPKKDDACIAHAQKAIERVVDRSCVDFRGHDLRRTTASLMVGAGVERLVVSRILNHVEPGVTAVFDRHSYDQKKRAALDYWGGRLEAIVSGTLPRREAHSVLRDELRSAGDVVPAALNRLSAATSDSPGDLAPAMRWLGPSPHE